MLHKKEFKFAQLAINKGLITVDKISECLNLMQNSHHQESNNLTNMLIEKGYITRKQAKQIQKELKNKEASNIDTSKSSEKLIGNYQVLEKLGEGAMGAVYKAKNINNGKIIALKVLDKKLSENKEFIKRFLKEASNAAKLKKHNNIVEAYDFGEELGKYYFAMEFVNGQSLAEILYSRGKIKEKTSIRITRQIARALEHIHNFSIIHRDIKPENIMLSSEGVVKLCDLGLAKDLSIKKIKSFQGIALGTVYYASPEQLQNKEIDIRSDIYSLGISLYHMLTGELPFESTSTFKVADLQVNEPLPPIQKKLPTASKEVAKLLNKMTSKNSKDRYQDPTELLTELDRILMGEDEEDDKTEEEEIKAEQIILKKKKKNLNFSENYLFYLIISIFIIIIILVFAIK